MIYATPDPEADIRQGDIFVDVPRVDIELSRLPIVRSNDSFEQVAWTSLIASERPDEVHAIVALRPVTAIVITQDCDAVRSPEIALCEVRDFKTVELKSKDVSAPGKWVSIITQHARVNQKWFYLPSDPKLGFTNKMGADFRTVLRVGRDDLDSMRKTHRIAALTSPAIEHFRERVGEFFRRYPYDEWYPLNKAEFDAYVADKGDDTKPFPWQT